MTSLADALSTTTSQARSRLEHLAGAAINRLRRRPAEDRATRARREAREFLQQRREALAKAFEQRTPR